jgi:hypothetical protein
LSRWGELAGIIETKELPVKIRYNKTYEPFILEILKQIKAVLNDLRQLIAVYDPKSSRNSSLNLDSSSRRTLDISDPFQQSSAVCKAYDQLEETDLDNTTPSRSRYPRGLNHLFQLAEDVFTVSKDPKRLVWAIKDQKRFRGGLEKLRDLTDYLHDSISHDNMNQSLWWTHETWLSVLQLSTTVEDMKALLAAERETGLYTGIHTETDGETAKLGLQLHETIERVTSFAVQMSSKRAKQSMFLDTHGTSSLRLLTNEDDGFRTSAILNEKPIWIEWRSYNTIAVPGDAGPAEFHPDPQSVQNVERLAWLLSQQDRPDSFRLPTCLGYIEDSREHRFGIVLRSWSGRPQSLLSRLETSDIGISGRCMIARQIAASLLYLHAVNWLHKGLRSAGILLGEDKSSPGTDEGRVLMSGFGFSRPSDNSFTSSGPPHDSKWSVYCHPAYLDTDRKSGYRKSYDIYSLGIILIEIALWKPIDQILEPLHSGRDSALGNERQDTRARILDSNTVIEQVRLNMDDRYAKATRACIEGLPAFGLSDDADEANPYVAALLQRSFIEVVVDPLKEVTP